MRAPGLGKCVLAGCVCPQTANQTAKRWCPAWWETVVKDAEGNEKVLKGCAWGQLPMFLNEFAKKAASAAEASQCARNEVAVLQEATVASLQLLMVGPHAQDTHKHPALGAAGPHHPVHTADSDPADVRVHSQGD